MDILYLGVGIGILAILLACVSKNKFGKVIGSMIGFLGGFFCAVLLAGFILPDFVGVHGIWLPFALFGTAFIIGMLFVWKIFSVKTRRIVALSLSGLFLLVTAIFIGPQIYRQFIPQAPNEEINLRPYMPFGDESFPDTLAKSLREESTLAMTENLPVLDGATALYPLYSAFVRATYPPDEYFPYDDLRTEHSMIPVEKEEISPPSIVVCSRTGTAFENLVDGYADIVFLMGVSEEQRESAAAKGVTLELTSIGYEAFVFFVNSRNGIEGLSVEEVKEIYSGSVTNWQAVGGNDDEIRAYQRPEDSGSQIMLKQIMGDTPIAPAPTEDIFSTMAGMYRRIAAYRNYRNSLGYSFLFYLRDMISEDQVKLLSIDGIAPESEQIKNRTYPFSHEIYAVTAKKEEVYLNSQRTKNIDRLIAWIRSGQGQFLVEETGYVPLQ